MPWHAFNFCKLCHGSAVHFAICMLDPAEPCQVPGPDVSCSPGWTEVHSGSVPVSFTGRAPQGRECVPADLRSCDLDQAFNQQLMFCFTGAQLRVPGTAACRHLVCARITSGHCRAVRP